MLMEPDEYTSQERALTDKAKELIEQHELDWGNGECFIQRDAGHSELYIMLVPRVRGTQRVHALRLPVRPPGRQSVFRSPI